MPEAIPKTLTLNGVHYEETALRDLVAQKQVASNPLKEKLFSFLQEWLNDDVQISLKTSGTTGAPKIMRIEKQRLVLSARMTGQFFGLRPGMKALLCLSPDFIAGKMMIVRAMELGLNLVTTNLDANPLKDFNQTVDFAAMVPLQVAQILRHQPRKFDLVRILIIGGGALPVALEEELQKISTQCWHTYAMTETLSHVALRPVNGPDRSLWFTPLQGITMGTDDRGCLVVNAPALAKGPVITNDLVELRAHQFRVLGRIDDVIISAGHKLHPNQIEQKLSKLIQFPFFLAGQDHPEAGQILVLYLEGSYNDKEIIELKEKIDLLLDSREVPRKVISIPKFKYLESGKIDRRGTIGMD